MTSMSNYHISDHNRWQRMKELERNIELGEQAYLKTGSPLILRLLNKNKSELIMLIAENDQEHGTMTTCDRCGVDVLVSEIKVVDAKWLCRECAG